MAFSSVFGNQPIRPAFPQFEALSITQNTNLVWPIETVAGVPYVAAQIDVTASTGDPALLMPDATQGATGIVTVISNVGANNFVLQTATGAAIQTIAPGTTWIITLSDNTTQAGTWRAYQLGSTVSTAVAAALAGAGLEADGSQLRLTIQEVSLSTNTNLDPTYRAVAIKWTGGTGTLQLNAASVLTDGWFCFVVNEGTGALTVSTTGGDLINGQASMVLPQGASGQFYSFMIVCSGTGFDTFGGVPSIIPISGGGTGANNATQALENLGGSTLGINIFEAPSPSAVIALLGLSTTPITEQTISGSQVLTPTSTGIAFVCTGALSLTLPLTTLLTTNYFFYAYAQGGDVTVIPDGTDAVNGGSVGANFTIPQGSSCLMVTDASHNWWPLFITESTAAGNWAVAGGTANAITATYSPPNAALTDGLLLGFRASGANSVTNPTFAPDGLTAHTITKFGGDSLATGDIPGNLAECLVRYNLAQTRWELLNPATPDLDLISSTQGDLLARGVSAWGALAIGTQGQVVRAGASLPGYDWEQPGLRTTISSASTTDLGTISTHNALIDGTTTITSFGSSANVDQPIYLISFDNVLTLTNSSSLILPGNADITTANGDTAVAEYLGSGNWQVRIYQVAASPPTPPGGSRFISTPFTGLGDGSSGSQAHGLGSAPASFNGYLVCVTADGAYSPGDIVVAPSASSGHGMAIWANATDVGYAINSNSNSVLITNKSGSGNINITYANWELVIEANT